MNSPTISVLVPVYNVESYLEACLCSLCMQSFDDFEVICINDGSTDGSRGIIQKFVDCDHRFRVIDKPNSGYGASMNQGLDAARGDYIAILESDDLFDSDALSLLWSAAKKNDSDVVKGDFWLYWTNPCERKEIFHVIDSREMGKTMRPLEDLAIFFRKPSIWSSLYRRTFIERNKIRFLETPGASYQDAGFNFKVWASAPRVTFIGDPVLLYRQDNEASSVKSASKAYCICDEYDSMSAFVKARGGSDEHLLLKILARMKFDSYCWNIDRLAGDLRLEFCERASSEFSQGISDGLIDNQFFEPGALADVTLLASDAKKYLSAYDRRYSRNRASSFGHYLRLGGPLLVARILLAKLSSTSVRRTNAMGGAA